MGWRFALIATVLVVRLIVPAGFGTAPVYLFLIPALLVISAVGGFGPGVLATCLTMAVELWFESHPARGDIVNAAAFFAIGIGMAWLGGRIQRASQTAEATNRDLLEREAHLKSILETIPDAMVVIDPKRSYPVLQLGGGTVVRPQGGRGDRPQCQPADANSLSGESRRLSRSLSADRRTPYHRRRARRGGRAQGRLDLSDGACHRRDEIERQAVLHRFHPRSDGASENRSPAAGIAGRARSYLASHRDGRNGLDACA